MANAVVVNLGETKGNAIKMTVGANDSISGGQICKLVDPRTASGAATGKADTPAGILAAEKDNLDSSTAAPVYTSGVFDIEASGAINAGDLVQISGNNLVSAMYTDTLSGINPVLTGKVFGRALETATDGEVIEVAIGPGVGI